MVIVLEFTYIEFLHYLLKHFGREPLLQACLHFKGKILYCTVWFNNSCSSITLSQTSSILKSFITNRFLSRQQESFLCWTSVWLEEVRCSLCNTAALFRLGCDVHFSVVARVKKSLFISSCCLSGIWEENELRGNQFDMNWFHWVSDVVHCSEPTWYFAATADFWIL